MNRVFVTGDCHGFNDIKKIKKFKKTMGSDLDASDVMIIAGDAGIKWSPFLNKVEDWWNECSFTTLVVLGNHENYDVIYSLETKEWNKGIVYFDKKCPKVLYAKNAQLFNINGFNIATLGGAASIDKHYRTKGASWWEQELPSKTEREDFLEIVKSNNVDYIITHTCPQKITPLTPLPQYDESFVIYLNEVYDNSEGVIKWFCGHWHIDGYSFQDSKEKVLFLFNNIVELEEK